MDIHCNKIFTENLEKILNEGKRFEVRRESPSEPEFKVGDELWLYETVNKGTHSPRLVECKITYIQRGYGLQENFCILGFNEFIQRE